jgi:hypothetical protein
MPHRFRERMGEHNPAPGLCFSFRHSVGNLLLALAWPWKLGEKAAEADWSNLLHQLAEFIHHLR